MNLLLITDPTKIPLPGWQKFVDFHPDGSIFQSPEMFEFFYNVPKFSPLAVLARDENENLKGVLLAVIIREMKGPTAFFSSRTVIYGGPLVDPEAEQPKEILEMLLNGLIRAVGHRSVFIQFRNFFSHKANQQVFESFGFHLRDRLNLIVDTSDRETVIRNMSASRWRQIRKGLGNQSAGTSPPGPLSKLERGNRGPGGEGGEAHAQIITPSDLSQVRQFYDILHSLYQYKVKKPLPSWEFFEQFYLLSRQGKLGVILLVEYQGRIIGGILSPITPGKTIYEWYVCGLDLEYREVHPSVLATWASMEYAIEHGIPEFDFMGVGIPEREYGVREFKSRFGGRLVNYGRFGRVNNRLFYSIAESGYNLLSVFRKI